MNNLSNGISSVLVPRQRNQNLDTNSTTALLPCSDSNLSVFIFATVKRSDVKAKPVMKRVTASSYKEARQQLIGNYVICFAGRIPSQEKIA